MMPNLARCCIKKGAGAETTGDVTVQTCWDADRLDLGRVGTRPDRRYLCTIAAKEKATIDWAYERSVRFHVPELVSVEWDAP